MIRVIYTWKVQKADQPKFKASWKKATSTIRETTDGARGSILLQSNADPNVFITIARWDKQEHWQAYWEDSARTEMDEMHSLAKRLSVDTYEEIADYTM